MLKLGARRRLIGCWADEEVQVSVRERRSDGLYRHSGRQ